MESRSYATDVGLENWYFWFAGSPESSPERSSSAKVTTPGGVTGSAWACVASVAEKRAAVSRTTMARALRIDDPVSCMMRLLHVGFIDFPADTAEEGRHTGRRLDRHDLFDEALQFGVEAGGNAGQVPPHQTFGSAHRRRFLFGQQSGPRHGGLPNVARSHIGHQSPSQRRAGVHDLVRQLYGHGSRAPDSIGQQGCPPAVRA